MALELRKIVRTLTVAIAACAIASAASLVFITSYLHRLTIQVDANLQSVRAAEEIELQLLFHARNMNQANLMSAPERRAVAARAQADILRWLDTARRYIGSEQERAVLIALESELDSYFAKQAELAEDDLSVLERYAQATTLVDGAFERAEELLRINVEQASAATQQSAMWDRIATAIGFSVAAMLLLLTSALIVGAHRAVYRPLLTLAGTIRRYAARDYRARVVEHGPEEIRAIGQAFNDMAEELERRRSQQLAFVASVAHDLRNPLAAMKAAVEASAAAGGAATRSHGKMMALVSRQIDVLVRMISDLLDAARIESGHFSLSPAEHDARELVLDAVSLFREAAPLHELVAVVPEKPLNLRYDSARMSQVLNNLLSNAIKYSPHGGRVEARAGMVENGAVIEIADQGIGVPEEESAAIFEPFRRGRTLSEAIPGVGIGLSVARRIVEAHGGTISVRSIIGVGSTFAIWLPASESVSEPAGHLARDRLLETRRTATASISAGTPNIH